MGLQDVPGGTGNAHTYLLPDISMIVDALLELASKRCVQRIRKIKAALPLIV